MISNYKLSDYAIASEPFKDGSLSEYRRVVLSARSGTVVTVSDNDWRKLSTGNLSELKQKDVYQLKSILLVVDQSEDELVSVLRENEAAISKNGILYHVIMPSALCQMGCHYCGQEHSNKTLSEERLQELINSIVHACQYGKYTDLSICWFGAEPLTAMKKIRSFSKALIGKAIRLGLGYQSNIVTNGLNLNENAIKILVEECRVTKFEITIDGDETAHNSTRSIKTGKPTYNSVKSNVERLINFARGLSDGIDLNIRCNVSKDNAKSVFKLIDEFHSMGVREDINFYVAPLHSWGNDAHQSALDAVDFSEFELAVFLYLHDLGFRTKVIPSRKKITCLAIHKDGVIMAPDGSSYNCTEVPLVPLYQEDDSYKIDLENQNRKKPFSSFMEGVKSGKWPCSTCALLPVCGGSCPKQWLEKLTPCPPFKKNIKDRLLLEYTKKVIL